MREFVQIISFINPVDAALDPVPVEFPAGSILHRGHVASPTINRLSISEPHLVPLLASHWSAPRPHQSSALATVSPLQQPFLDPRCNRSSSSSGLTSHLGRCAPQTYPLSIQSESPPPVPIDSNESNLHISLLPLTNRAGHYPSMS